MFEIIVAIIVIVCIIYIFKGDFTRSAGVTVLESLPLSIFKKWNKEENSIKEEESIDEIDNIDEVSNMEKSDSIESLEKINKMEEKLMDKSDNCSENTSDILINNGEEIIENKNIIEADNGEVKEEYIVYWTPNGKTYHMKSTCRTLARSKVINSGTVYESGKDFKCEHCK